MLVKWAWSGFYARRRYIIYRAFAWAVINGQTLTLINKLTNNLIQKSDIRYDADQKFHYFIKKFHIEEKLLVYSQPVHHHKSQVLS